MQISRNSQICVPGLKKRQIKDTLERTLHLIHGIIQVRFSEPVKQQCSFAGIPGLIQIMTVNPTIM